MKWFDPAPFRDYLNVFGPNGSNYDRKRVISLELWFTAQRPPMVLLPKIPLLPKKHFPPWTFIKYTSAQLLTEHLERQTKSVATLLWIFEPWMFYICKAFLKGRKAIQNSVGYDFFSPLSRSCSTSAVGQEAQKRDLCFIQRVFKLHFFSFATEKKPLNVFIKRVKKQHILVLYRHKKT